MLLLCDINRILFYPSFVTEITDLGKKASIYDECSKSKYCFGDRVGCIKEKNCDFLATVTFVNSSKHVIIDLYKESLKDNEYVAVGFSGDKLMGDDLVFMSSPSEDVLMKAWNVRYSHPEDVGGITELDYSKSHENGMFHCKFELEKMLTFTNVASGEQKTVDFYTSAINLLCSPVSPAVSPGSPLRDLLWQLPDASLAADGQEGSVKKKIKLKKNILVPSTSLLPLETLMSTYTCK